MGVGRAACIPWFLRYSGPANAFTTSRKLRHRRGPGASGRVMQEKQVIDAQVGHDAHGCPQRDVRRAFGHVFIHHILRRESRRVFVRGRRPLVGARQDALVDPASAYPPHHPARRPRCVRRRSAARRRARWCPPACRSARRCASRRGRGEVRAWRSSPSRIRRLQHTPDLGINASHIGSRHLPDLADDALFVHRSHLEDHHDRRHGQSIFQ